MIGHVKSCLAVLCFCLSLSEFGFAWPGYPRQPERQYEPSRLKNIGAHRASHRKPGGFYSDPDSIGRFPPYHAKPGQDHYDTPGGNEYGHNDADAGQGQGYLGGARQVYLNPHSIDDAAGGLGDDDEDAEQQPADPKKCRPFYSLNCERFCPAGNSLDQVGCRTCTCCPVLRCRGECSHGVIKVGGCATCNCRTPPSHILQNCPRKWCTKECKLGFAKDRNGCPLCRCLRRKFQTRWHSKFQ